MTETLAKDCTRVAHDWLTFWFSRKNLFMMPPKKIHPRAEHRQREEQRVQLSPTLAAKYPQLKSLAAEMAYCDHEKIARFNTIKYRFNLESAKSVVRFECPNFACVGGDFDLSQELADGVAGRRTVVSGEQSCQGWRNVAAIATERCFNILRYQLNLGFARRTARPVGSLPVTQGSGAL